MSVAYPQAGVLLPPPPVARYLEFDLRGGATRALAESSLESLADGPARGDGSVCVVGIGASLAGTLGLRVAGLREFPPYDGAPVAVPVTPRALWIWVRGSDRGELVHRSHAVELALAPAFAIAGAVDAFVHRGGRDLTGYEDGTENPKGEAAAEAAICSGSDGTPAGSSFVAVQLWQHDFPRFSAMTKQQQDNAIGRERESNEELEDAPESAHVKRTAQEDFDPAAFVVRRSMPWNDASRAGLMFVAFATTLDHFERQMRRMAGLDDGIVDGLFQFTKPVTGAYYWCPPVAGGRLAWRQP